MSHPYDPQKALQLLGEAGWKDTDGDGILDKMIDGQKMPFRFEIKFNSGNEIRKSIALTLQDELKKHGVDASVRQLDWTIYLDEVRHHKFDAIILGWGCQPSNRMTTRCGTPHRRTTKARIISAIKMPGSTPFSKSTAALDPQKRIELYREFQQILNQEQPYTFLFIQKSILAVEQRFQNINLYPAGPRSLEWWVPKAQQRYHELVSECPCSPMYANAFCSSSPLSLG